METKVVNLKVKSNIDEISREVSRLNTNFDNTSKEIREIQKSTKNAENEVNSLAGGFKDVGLEIKNIQKSTKNTEVGVTSLAGGFKGMGLAIKAVGIGLVLEAFNLFKEVLSKNQKIVDIFNTAIGALSIAFNDLIGFLFDKLPGVVNLFKDVFENPTTYLKKFGDLIKENLTERFNSFLDTIGYLGDALKKVFTGDFAGAMESVKKAGKESIDVLTGVNNTFDRGKKAIEETIDGITKYASKTIDAAEANVKLQKSAEIAAAKQALLVEQYDIEAEKLRKIRDNTLLSVKDRIEANDKLKEVLKNQGEAMTELANLQIKAAAATYGLNKTTENEIALINAKTNALGVLAQVEGLTSEQESNRVGLKTELNQLTDTEIQGINQLVIEQGKANEALIADDEKRLELQRINLEEEKRIELERLQNKINSATLGTQARLDAELEYKNKNQEINNALKENDKELLDVQLANSQARLEIEKLEYEHKRKMLDATTALLDTAAGALGDSTVAGKAAAVASATIKTLLASVDAFQGMVSAIPGPAGVAAGIAASGFAVLSGFKTVKGILAVKTPKGSGGGGATPSTPSAMGGAPQFNVVGNTGANQLAQSMANQNSQPLQAYVVSGAVTSAQSLDRNIISNASIG
jgi:hypothetical protein